MEPQHALHARTHRHPPALALYSLALKALDGVECGAQRAPAWPPMADGRRIGPIRRNRMSSQ
jgi:hypothetical protein